MVNIWECSDLFYYKDKIGILYIDKLNIGKILLMLMINSRNLNYTP